MDLIHHANLVCVEGTFVILIHHGLSGRRNLCTSAREDVVRYYRCSVKTSSVRGVESAREEGGRLVSSRREGMIRGMPDRRIVTPQGRDGGRTSGHTMVVGGDGGRPSGPTMMVRAVGGRTSRLTMIVGGGRSYILADDDGGS
jgi:hypothetical protein